MTPNPRELGGVDSDPEVLRDVGSEWSREIGLDAASCDVELGASREFGLEVVLRDDEELVVSLEGGLYVASRKEELIISRELGLAVTLCE